MTTVIKDMIIKAIYRINTALALVGVIGVVATVDTAMVITTTVATVVISMMEAKIKIMVVFLQTKANMAKVIVQTMAHGTSTVALINVCKFVL